MDKLGFLDGGDTESTDTPVEDLAPTVEEAAPVEAEAPAPVETPEPTPEAKPEPVMVPLAALHEVRDEVKTLKAKLVEKEQPAPEPVEAPDMFSDPEGYQAHTQAQIQRAIYQERLNSSFRFAEIQHGKETVEQAHQWGLTKCAADPAFNAKILASPDPIGTAIDEWKRDQIASNVTADDFSQFQAWKAAQASLATPQPAQVAEQQPQSLPPQSIASAPSAGGVAHTPTGPGQAYDSLFRTG